MKKRFCLLIALLLSLGLSCAAEPILEPTPFLLEAEELLELVDQYQQVPSIALGEEATLNVLKDAELILGAEPTAEETILDTDPAEVKTILDTGAVITLADRAVINVYGALRGWIADIVMGEESEINIFLSSGALMDALLPEELVEPEKLEELKASFTYYGLNISDLDDPDSIAVFDASGNRIHFGSGDKTDSIVYPGERYTVLFKTGLNKGRRLSFELDPSVPLSLAELLAQNPITAKLILEATDVTEGADVPFTATLSRAARRKAVVTLRVGEADYTIDIPAGTTSGSVLVANPNGEDPYLDAGTLTATVTGFSGGGFDRVYYRDVSATANISDTIDTTAVSLSATDGREGDANVTFTVTLSNPAQTAATATVKANGKSYTVTIPAGKSSGTVSVPNPNAEDVYLDASVLTATVSAFSGGNFEQVDFSKASATATISDTIDTTRVSLSAADGKEGDSYVTFTVSLSNPAQTAATATVKANGKSYTVSIPAGKSSGTVSVPNPNAEDVYLDASALTATVTGFSGGNFEQVDFSKATATANISDTIDATAVSLSAADGKESDANISFTVSLSHPTQTAATATVKANGKSYTVTIPAGKSSATVSVPNPYTNDPYIGERKLTASVSGFSGGNFEKVDYSGATATANISDTIDATTVSLSVTDGKEGDSTVRFTVSLSNAARTAATATVRANGKSYTVTIPTGKSSGTVSVPNPNTEDVYLDASTLTATVTGFSGGNFEQVDFSKATATANIADTTDTTAVTLSATDGKEGDSTVRFTVSLSNAARTAATATVKANGKSYTVTIPAGKSSGTVSVPNPYANDAYIGARTLTGTVTAFEGGDFEAVDFSKASATANISDTIDATAVSLSAADGKEGDANISFTVSLSHPTQTAATATVNANGKSHTVTIPAGKSSGTVSVPNPNAEDVYLDASALTASVSGFSGGNFEKVDYSGATATANISDTIDTTAVSLSATDGKEGDANISFTVTLDNAARTAATATVRVGGTDYAVTIPAGASSANLSVPNPNTEDVYLGASTLTASVIDFEGGDFEAVDFSKASATANIADTVDTTTVSLSATDGKEGDANISFTVTLDNAARTAATATVKANGKSHTVTIPAGKSSATVSVPNPYTNDPYIGARTLTGTVTAFEGGDFEAVDFSKATATANIADTIDTTTVSLSAPSAIDRKAESVTFTITLSKPAQTAATATVRVGETDYIVNIAANATSGSLSVPINGASSLTGRVPGLTGGNFEKLDVSGASTTVRICDPVIVSLSANDVSEGTPVRFTVTLSAPAQTAATATVRVGETDYTVKIAAGATSGSVDVPNPNTEDAYIDGTRLTASVTGFSGGGFDLVSYSGATTTVRITDTIDTTRVSLSASDYLETDAYTTFTVRLSNPAQTDATVTLNVSGPDYLVNIAANATSGSVSVPINGAASLKGTVTGLTGGNFEAVDYSSATATARIHNTTTVSITGPDVGMGDPFIKFTIRLSNPPTTDAAATVKVGNADQTVTISAGKTSESLFVRNPHLGETSFVTYTLSAEVTSISGGGFTSVDCSSAKATVSITPVPIDWH